MAVITWQRLFSDISAGQAAGVYLFEGQEEFIKSSALEKLRASILPEGLEQLNETVLDGATAVQITDGCETLPVMCDKRLFVVKDYAPLAQQKSKDEANECERIEAFLKNPPDTCVAVFYLRGEADKRKKLYKAFEKSASVVKFQYLTDDDLRKWVKARLRPFGKTISSAALDALIFLGGRDLTRLSGEVDKLASYAQASEITDGDVRDNISPSAESNVFLMIDSIMQNDAKKAYSILNTLLESGESCVGILALLTRQMRLLSHVKLLKDEKVQIGEIASRTGLTDFVARRAYSQCTKISSEALISGYRLGVECDYLVKSGKMRDRAALDKMMASLFKIS